MIAIQRLSIPFQPRTSIVMGRTFNVSSAPYIKGILKPKAIYAGLEDHVIGQVTYSFLYHNIVLILTLFHFIFVYLFISMTKKSYVCQPHVKMALSVGVHNHLLRSALNPKRTPADERAAQEYHEAPISADLAADIAAMELAHPRASRDAVRKATGTIIPPGQHPLSILSRHHFTRILTHTPIPTLSYPHLYQ